VYGREQAELEQHMPTAEHKKRVNVLFLNSIALCTAMNDRALKCYRTFADISFLCNLKTTRTR